MFKIGESIKRKNGSFTGKIVAIEEHSGGLVCVSDKISSYRDDRTRYVYMPHELEHKYKMLRFTPSSLYTIHGVEMNTSLNSDNPAMVNLISTCGKVRYYGVPRNVDALTLYDDFGISHKLVKEL